MERSRICRRKRSENNITSIDYADMLWLPTALNLRPLGMLYDWVFLDEAQDSSIAAIALFKKCVKPNVGRWLPATLSVLPKPRS